MLLLRSVLAVTCALAVPAASSGEDASTPLLEAMAYVHPGAEVVSVDLIDWAQLKRLHDGESITSASPLLDRQRLMLDIVHSESVPIGLGIDRLASWPEAWGWDSTDLDWHARYWDGRNVLRFGQHWDPAPFRSALESRGYELDAAGGIEVWLPPETKMPTRLRLEQVGAEINAADMSHTFAAVTIGTDGRTVVIHSIGAGEPPRPLRRASRPDLERVAGTPAVRAATALGHPVAATVVASREGRLCAWPGASPFTDAPEIGDIVDGLHAWVVQATGYSRESTDTPVAGRYVFSYDRPRQAQADLAGRSALVEMGPLWDPPTEISSLTDARVEGRDLILDVEPVSGDPGPYLMGWHTRTWAPFAMCGSST